MDTLKYIYQLDKRFFRILIIWFVLVFVLSFSLSKTESFQLINSFHHPLADYFFSVVTHLGDGLFVVIVGLALVFWKKMRKLGIALLITYIVSGLVCAALKRVFSNPRPASLLAEDPSFHALPWMPMAYNNSFPSGHTTSIFAAATAVALFGNNRRWSLWAIFIACTAAYSRVYLAQHFVEDLWFGILLGSGITIICYLAYRAVLLRTAARIHWGWPSFKI